MFEGIYIHFPFCEKKCPYCDFFSVERRDYKDYLELLLKEASLYAGFGNLVKTLYFGGGTPSLLRPEEIQSIIQKLGEIFDLSRLEEITVECNPESYGFEDFKKLVLAKVNRLSFGVQSFSKKWLKFLGRSHSPEVAKRAIIEAKRAGFENINIDIIFGFPGQNQEELIYDLEVACSLEPSHISAYILTIYEDTAFEMMLKRGQIEKADEDKVAELYILADKFLKERGFLHYEVCNFSKEGFECKHNLLYWQQKPFLGLGASAWGFIQGIRYGNFRNLKLYEEWLNRGLRPIQSFEILESKELFFDYIFCNLRLKDGIDRWLLPKDLELFGELWEVNRGRLSLSSKGWLLINEVLMRLEL